MTIRKYEGSADAALERALEDAKKEKSNGTRDWDRIRNSRTVQERRRSKRRRRSHATIRANKRKREALVG